MHRKIAVKRCQIRQIGDEVLKNMGKNSSLDILGVTSKRDLNASIDAWYIIFIVCGTLVVLMVIDGIYLISMNHRLREAARLSEQASRAKTQFFSAMSHDIRKPDFCGKDTA
ncbi:hypothetical protein [Roseburia sp.]|uniref:hypothetical protein n=1 Tax=Roseburia sp. TaxID=2049040 RepID=UPI00352037B5